MKRCARCKKFLSAAWHHRYCLKCKRIINRAKAAVNDIEQAAKCIISPVGKCATCHNDAVLVSVRRYSKRTGALIDEQRVCEKCKYWFQTRLLWQ